MYVSQTQPMGFIPLVAIPWILGAGGLAVGAGTVGYELGKPDVDPTTGERIPTFGEKVGEGVNTALLLAAAGGVGYWWFFKRKGRA